MSRSGRPPWRSPGAAVLLLAALSIGCAAAPRLIESVPGEDYALWGSGRLEPSELAELCARGVDELLEFSGTAAVRECRWREETCPGLEILYGARQDVEVPVSESFLAAFDAWVLSARREGRVIAFRDWSGYHRFGRLAAYYQMRFQNLTLEDALLLMFEHGRFMWLHPQLEPQVRALADHLAQRPCSVPERFCVRQEWDPAVERANPPRFVEACP